jgi:thymidylate kinase
MGLFICVTGIDGSGKTTHALSLCKELLLNGVECVYARPEYMLMKFFPSRLQKWIYTRFDTRSKPIVAPVKSRMRSSGGRNLSFLGLLLAFLFLFYSFATYRLLIRSLRNRFTLICDRYFFSWFYNACGEFATALVHLIPKPDLVILLDTSVTLAFSRMHDCKDKVVPLRYYRLLRDWYVTVARREGFLIVDSGGDLEETKKEIQRLVTPLLKRCGELA